MMSCFLLRVAYLGIVKRYDLRFHPLSSVKGLDDCEGIVVFFVFDQMGLSILTGDQRDDFVAVSDSSHTGIVH